MGVFVEGAGFYFRNAWMIERGGSGVTSDGVEAEVGRRQLVLGDELELALGEGRRQVLLEGIPDLRIIADDALVVILFRSIF